MLRQFFAAPGSSRNGNRPSADRFAAGDVARGIADHIDLVSGKFATMLFPGARASELTELIAIVVIVGKGAEFEKMPNAVVIKLQLSAPRKISGEQGEDDVLSCS